MAKHRYKVLRRIIGDKIYEPGDERIAEVSDVAHLVPKVLEDLGPVAAAKAEGSAPANKAENAPANKAEKPAGKGAKKDND